MELEAFFFLIVDLILNCLFYFIMLELAIVAFNLCLLHCQNAKVRYYACYFSYVVSSSITSVALIVFFPWARLTNRNLSVATLPARALTKCLGIDWEVRGLKYIEGKMAGVVIFNHQSMFDILGLFVLGSSLRNVITVARRVLLYVWPIGLAIKLSGTTVFIDRENPKHAMQVLENAIDRIKKYKMKLVVFPEGTRNFKGDKLLPFRKGAFRIAIQSKLPIIPVVLSPYHFINSQQKTFHRGTIIVSALPPISTKGTTINELEELIDKTHRLMEEEYKKLKSEVNAG